MLGAALVWAWLVLGLRLLSGGGAWHLGWAGALVTGTLLWPVFAAGYFSLKRLAFSSPREQDDEMSSIAWETALGMPMLIASFVISLMVLGLLRFVDSFSRAPSGGMLNLLMSVLGLHVLAWGAAGATHWAAAAWRDRDEE